MHHLLLLFKRDIERLEYDPAAQYRFHFVAAWAWFVAMLVVPFFDRPQTGTAWVALVILEASLWANFATHFGAMSAALAAKASQPPVLTLSQSPVSDELILTPGQVVTPSPADIEADFSSGLLE